MKLQRTKWCRPETLYIVQLVTFLITFFVTQELDAACAGKWFGANCTYKCMCWDDEVCDEEGNCPENRCAKAFFGPKCQYLDRVTQDGYNPSVPSYLQDSDSSTCNPDATATSVQVTLNNSYLFMWFRIVVNTERYLANFTVQTNSLWCHNPQLFMGPNMVDVSCANQLGSNSLTIRGPIAADICSIFISGGRNVALRQLATQVDTYPGNPPAGPENAVDGVRLNDFNARSCTQTKLHSEWDRPWLNVKFNRPQYILSVFVYNRNTNQNRMRGLNLEAYNIPPQMVYILYQPNVDQDVYYYHGRIGVVVTDITLRTSGVVDNSERHLTVCELETYGETLCPDGTFGLWCEQICQCKSVEICHPVTGICAAGCPPGFYGFNCTTPCSGCKDGKCANVDGKCVTCIPGKVGVYCENDCLPGFFGVNCSWPCSVVCVDGLCTPAEGKCYHCHPGFRGGYCEEACERGHYGVACSSLCGNSCKNAICQHIDGKCIACYPGMEGDQCERECRDGFFGDKCATNCSKQCTDVCAHKTGNCACKPNFGGAQCFDCDTRLFGEDCTESCSVLCSGPKCNRTHGVCFKCIDDHSGPFCEEEINRSALSGPGNLWIIILLLSGLTVAICGTLFLCGKRQGSKGEEN